MFILLKNKAINTQFKIERYNANVLNETCHILTPYQSCIGIINLFHDICLCIKNFDLMGKTKKRAWNLMSCTFHIIISASC